MTTLKDLLSINTNYPIANRILTKLWKNDILNLIKVFDQDIWGKRKFKYYHFQFKDFKCITTCSISQNLTNNVNISNYELDTENFDTNYKLFKELILKILNLPPFESRACIYHILTNSKYKIDIETTAVNLQNIVDIVTIVKIIERDISIEQDIDDSTTKENYSSNVSIQYIQTALSIHDIGYLSIDDMSSIDKLQCLVFNLYNNMVSVLDTKSLISTLYQQDDE